MLKMILVVFTFMAYSIPSKASDVPYIPQGQDLRHHPNYHLINQECGSSITNRIFGGNDARLGQFPWMARIVGGYVKVDEKWYLNGDCGGFIINNRYILTAAHCTESDKESYTIVLGDHRKSTDPDCEFGVCAPPVESFGVEEIIPHFMFTRERKLHSFDISLLRLKRPIMLNDFVQPICLPTTSNFVITNEWTEIAGWGMSLLGDQIIWPDVLQVLRIKVLPYEYCNWGYQISLTWSDNISNEAMSTQFCTGDEYGKNSCIGDSGSPVMMPLSLDGITRYYAIGINSFGPINCNELPSFKTNVYLFVEWILDNIRP